MPSISVDLTNKMEERSQFIRVLDETLGLTQHKHQDWFDENDEEITKLLEEKNRLLRANISDKSSASKAAFSNARNTVPKKLHAMQDKWLSQKAEEIQCYADMNDMKRFYESVKTVYGHRPASSSPLLSADRTTLITEKSRILERWAEHFHTVVLNRPSYVNEEAINQLPQVPINHEMDAPPTLPEVEKAIHQLSSGKAPGADAIPAEVYKHAGPQLKEKMTQLFQAMWTDEAIPQDFKDTSVKHLYKRKGNRQVCDNHRGISLLCIAEKVLARILLNRLIDHLENGLLPESQCGLRKGCGTIDMVFVACQLQEKCQEQNVDLYITFVDFTKAFDTVSPSGL